MSAVRLAEPVVSITLMPTGAAREYQLDIVDNTGGVTRFIFELDADFDPQRYAKSDLHWRLKDRGLEMKIVLKKALVGFEVYMP